jgi:EAL domain-containing protein (putative c-di-GMP-specific phosphodiesterase class I)
VELGCEVMQGYFIARPMSEDALMAWAVKWELK